MLLLLASLSVLTGVALTYLGVRLKRHVAERRQREELERCEDSQRTIERLREAFTGEALAHLVGDQTTQFS